MSTIKTKWDAYFSPEPELTSSLIRVYSRLQNDETLILKGWKLSEQRPTKSLGHRLLAEGWLFAGLFRWALAHCFSLVVTQVKSMKNGPGSDTFGESSNVSTNENLCFCPDPN